MSSTAAVGADTPAIEVRGLHKSYRLGKENIHVLRSVSFSVAPGRFVAVVGPSGSGKSTLLHLLGLLDRPDRGEILIEGIEATRLPRRRRNRIRCRDIGFVFQFYHLLPELSVLQNVLLPAKVGSSLAGYLRARRRLRDRAAEVLRQVGLGERLKHRPRELSGGERQRVAIARALMNDPKILLADEPTGNLDMKTGRQIMETIRRLSRSSGRTVVMVTHDEHLAASADRIFHLRDGKLSKSQPAPVG
ncbi:MAG: ABC transporter ATP-binding protein [Planctomycetes bacterium]|nr:ABC transporter ATP-binding protein [Planctomycetota bacterium]